MTCAACMQKAGMYKADICRGAVLFNRGGYYFDADLLVLRDMRQHLPGQTTFSTCHNARYRGDWWWNSPAPTSTMFFQAFMASTARHGVLKLYLQQMNRYYWMKFSGELSRPQLDELDGLMGTVMLRRAFDEWVAIGPPELLDTVYLLQEEHLNLMRQDPRHAMAMLVRSIGEQWQGRGDGCNFLVYDPHVMQLVFYSRAVGASLSCADVQEQQSMWRTIHRLWWR